MTHATDPRSDLRLIRKAHRHLNHRIQAIRLKLARVLMTSDALYPPALILVALTSLTPARAELQRLDRFGASSPCDFLLRRDSLGLIARLQPTFTLGKRSTWWQMRCHMSRYCCARSADDLRLSRHPAPTIIASSSSSEPQAGALITLLTLQE
jgi:hypothetical protein